MIQPSSRAGPSEGNPDARSYVPGLVPPLRHQPTPFVWRRRRARRGNCDRQGDRRIQDRPTDSEAAGGGAVKLSGSAASGIAGRSKIQRTFGSWRRVDPNTRRSFEASPDCRSHRPNKSRIHPQKLGLQVWEAAKVPHLLGFLGPRLFRVYPLTR